MAQSIQSVQTNTIVPSGTIASNMRGAQGVANQVYGGDQVAISPLARSRAAQAQVAANNAGGMTSFQARVEAIGGVKSVQDRGAIVQAGLATAAKTYSRTQQLGRNEGVNPPGGATETEARAANTTRTGAVQGTPATTGAPAEANGVIATNANPATAVGEGQGRATANNIATVGTTNAGGQGFQPGFRPAVEERGGGQGEVGGSTNANRIPGRGTEGVGAVGAETNRPPNNRANRLGEGLNPGGGIPGGPATNQPTRVANEGEAQGAARGGGLPNRVGNGINPVNNPVAAERQPEPRANPAAGTNQQLEPGPQAATARAAVAPEPRVAEDQATRQVAARQETGAVTNPAPRELPGVAVNAVGATGQANPNRTNGVDQREQAGRENPDGRQAVAGRQAVPGRGEQTTANPDVNHGANRVVNPGAAATPGAVPGTTPGANPREGRAVANEARTGQAAREPRRRAELANPSQQPPPQQPPPQNPAVANPTAVPRGGNIPQNTINNTQNTINAVQPGEAGNREGTATGRTTAPAAWQPTPGVAGGATPPRSNPNGPEQVRSNGREAGQVPENAPVNNTVPGEGQANRGNNTPQERGNANQAPPLVLNPNSVLKYYARLGGFGRGEMDMAAGSANGFRRVA